jgi:hypothetical protein
MKCWICGATAESGEHLIKASDIRSVFGNVGQTKSFFMHTDEKRNQKIQGIKAKKLKFKARLCFQCNNERTQPHDRAWEKLSYYIRNRQPPFKIGDKIRVHKAFPGSVKNSILNVHLFFLKVFGCQIAEHNVPIDLNVFSEAILKNKPHPNVYIAIAPGIDKKLKSIGASEITTAQLNGRIVYAVWYYFLDNLSVRVMYSEPGERRQGLVDSWHPGSIQKCLKVTRL